MTIRFEQTVDDTLAYYRYFLKTNKQARRAVRIAQFGIPVALWVLMMIVTRDWKFGIALAVVFLIWMLVIPRYMRRSMLRKTRRNLAKPENSRMLGNRSMELGEEGFRIATETAETHFKWAGVIRVVRETGYTFLFLSEQEAVIVPTGRLSADENAAIEKALEMYVKPNEK